MPEVLFVERDEVLLDVDCCAAERVAVELLVDLRELEVLLFDERVAFDLFDDEREEVAFPLDEERVVVVLTVPLLLTLVRVVV